MKHALDARERIAAHHICAIKTIARANALFFTGLKTAAAYADGQGSSKCNTKTNQTNAG